MLRGDTHIIYLHSFLRRWRLKVGGGDAESSDLEEAHIPLPYRCLCDVRRSTNYIGVSPNSSALSQFIPGDP